MIYVSIFTVKSMTYLKKTVNNINQSMAIYSLYLTFLKQFLLSKNGSYSLKSVSYVVEDSYKIDCTFYSITNIPNNPFNH